jgi:serine/threonine protein kinase
MGPEVLRGDPVDEKSDVYSFGIVLWEILTRKAPFSHHTQLKTFMKAIVEKCERPLIPPETLPSFRELIEKCWAHNPTDRPSFAEILPALDNVLTEIAVADPQGRALWKKHFSGLAEMEWDKFVAAFYSFLGLGAPIATDKKYIWLQSLCVAQVSDITKEKSTEVVTLENFGKFCSWFGPLNKEVLDRLSGLCAFPWFYGKMSSAEVSSLLTGKPKATFLVRLSESSEGCFTISKVEKTAEVNHQRVLYNLKDGTYTIAIAGKQMPFKSLPEIVAFKDLKLKIAPAEKNKFQMMLEGNKEPVYLK